MRVGVGDRPQGTDRRHFFSDPAMPSNAGYAGSPYAPSDRGSKAFCKPSPKKFTAITVAKISAPG